MPAFAPGRVVRLWRLSGLFVVSHSGLTLPPVNYLNPA